MRVALLLITAVILSLLAGSFVYKSDGVSEVSKETAFDRVIRTGVLRCGYAMSPPMLLKDPNTGELSGLSYDIMTNFASELDIKIDWVEEVGWGDFIEGLRSNRYDMFCSQLWPDAGRLKNLALVGPVIYSFLYPYARADDDRFDGNLQRINQSDIRVPVIDGDISYSMAENGFPKAERLSLSQMATFADMIQSVLTKKADIFFFDVAMIEAIPEEDRKKLKRVPDIESAFTYSSYFGLLAGETQLQSTLNVIIQKMIDDGRLEKLAASYSSDYVTPAKGYAK